MPFKSEKQRKYLWANEPEIARDWTDTYGSKIHKANGGRIGFRVGKGAGMEQTSDTGMPEGGSGANYSGGNTGGGGHHPGGDHRGPTTYTKPKTQPKPDKEYGLANKNLNRGGIRGYIADTRSKIMPKLTKKRALHELKRRMSNEPFWGSGLYGDDDEDLWTTQTGNPHLDYSEKDINRITEIQDYFDGGKGNFNLTQDQYYDIFPHDKPIIDTGGGGEGVGLPYIWPYEVASAPIEEEEIIETDPINRYAGSYRVRPEYLIAEGGRVPAAFGGIMDSYTGRRAYGLGSIFKKAASLPKKAIKAVKKLASSPIGKLALGYLATSGLAGLGSGTGMQGFYKPGRFMENIAGSWNRFAPQVLKESTTKSLPFDWKDKAARLAGEDKGNLLTKGLGWIKENPTAAILGSSLGAGLYTAKQPVEELDLSLIHI